MLQMQTSDPHGNFWHTTCASEIYSYINMSLLWCGYLGLRVRRQVHSFTEMEGNFLGQSLSLIGALVH